MNFIAVIMLLTGSNTVDVYTEPYKTADLCHQRMGEIREMAEKNQTAYFDHFCIDRKLLDQKVIVK